jgi:hypothetical protein
VRRESGHRLRVLPAQNFTRSIKFAFHRNYSGLHASSWVGTILIIVLVRIKN